MASHVVQELEQVTETTADYASLRAAEGGAGREIEQRYAPILEPGIALTITFESKPTDVEDADIDFVVLIAPNTEKEEGSAALPEGPSIDLEPEDAVYFKRGPQRAEEPGRFVEWVEESGKTYLKIRMSRLHHSGATMLILKASTWQWRKVEKSQHKMSLHISVDEREYTDNLVSGHMTKEEYELGFPENMLVTHTERRALDKYPEHLHTGAHWQMQGFLLACPICKGKINAAALTGATFAYEPGGFTAPKQKKPRR